MGPSYLPHRQLRNPIVDAKSETEGYLPHRQLRKINADMLSLYLSYLPHRQLRNGRQPFCIA